MKRLTNEQLEKNFTFLVPDKRVIIPTFPYLYKSISQELSKLSLEENIQRRLKKSIGDLPTILEPLLNESGTIKNIAKARILFFEYAVKNDIPRKMADSKTLREKYGLSKMKLRQDIYMFFQEQIAIHKRYLDTKSFKQIINGRTMQEYLQTSTYWQMNIPTQEAVLKGSATIAQLLVADPTIFYILPEIL